MFIQAAADNGMLIGLVLTFNPRNLTTGGDDG